MRELKVRAWDDIEKRMKYFDFMDIHVGVYHPTLWKDSEGIPCELDDKRRYPHDLMLLTGLRDKNSNKSYEEDIICFQNNYPGDTVNPEEVNYDIAVVTYMKEDAAYCARVISGREVGNTHTMYELLDEYGEFEIIGNKWENPELLEKKNERTKLQSMEQ